MTTGLQEVHFTAKKLLGLDDFETRIFNRLRSELQEMHSHIWTADGVFDTQITLAADGNDKFKLVTFSDCVDGEGHILNPTAELVEDIQFQNTIAIQYDVALHHAQRPRDVQINPRTGQPELRCMEETIGLQGAPNSVAIQGGGLRFTLTNLTEAGVSHAGRTAVVWKKIPGPNATDEDIAIEVLTIAFTGGANVIDSADVFGQDGTPSTTAADYEVTVLGPCVRRNTSLVALAGYVFIGKVTGVGAGSPPAVFSTTGQVILDTTLTDIDAVTRVDAHGFLKIAVDADGTDAEEAQIRVRNAALAVTFSVDEDGDLVANGGHFTADTLFDGEATFLDNVNMGDADGDGHAVRGDWAHTFGGVINMGFNVSGANGHVGIGTAYSASLQLLIAGITGISFSDTSTSSPDPDTTTRVSLLIENTASTVNNRASLFFLHADTEGAPSRDGMVVFSQRDGAGDTQVALRVANISNSAFGTTWFEINATGGVTVTNDLSVGDDVDVGGNLQVTDDIETLAGEFVGPNVFRAFANITMTNATPFVPSVNSGFGVSGIARQSATVLRITLSSALASGTPTICVTPSSVSACAAGIWRGQFVDATHVDIDFRDHTSTAQITLDGVGWVISVMIGDN